MKTETSWMELVLILKRFKRKWVYFGKYKEKSASTIGKYKKKSAIWKMALIHHAGTLILDPPGSRTVRNEL